MEKFAYIIVEPKTREEKRKAIRDAKKIESIFRPIEEDFIFELFTSNKSYNDCYIEYLNMFKDNCEWIHQSRKFRNFKINDKYFVNQYKPIENERNFCFLWKKYL